MEKNVIRTFNLADYMSECITKYAYNKEIFDTQTQATINIFDIGDIDFDKFYKILDKEIEYDNNDKETLAKLVYMQMNNWLHENINSLTLLFPKMQFFMEYYNKYQDDLVFFVDMKHVCMVYGMMHILETILKCTENIINDIKKINSDIIECSNIGRTYKHNGINSQLSYFLVTKYEIEKIFIYILQPFLPTDHFIDLVNLFHIESVCGIGIFSLSNNVTWLHQPYKNKSAMLRMSTYCYIYFDVLETDAHNIQKNVTHIFFQYFLKEKNIPNIIFNKQRCYDLQDLLIHNVCFSIYIGRNADKLCDKLKETFDKLVTMHNHMQNIVLPDITKNKTINYMQKNILNGDNRIPNKDQNDEECIQETLHKYDDNLQKTDKSMSFYFIASYILNCLCNSIIASEATFLMSYDITCDKKLLEKIITHCMEILENRNDEDYVSMEFDEHDISFKKPKFKKEKKNKKINN